MNNTEKKPMLQQGSLIAFSMLVTCFALWGLLNNMTDTLVPSFAKIFMIDAVSSAMVQVAFYGSYAVLAIPAALIIKKYSFRAGILIGLGFYMVGALGYIPAAAMQSYDLFLVSIFILAGGLSVLETTCNPFVLSMGPRETAIMRLNFAQAFNPLGSLAGLFIARGVILGNLDSSDLAARKAMSADQLAGIRDNELFWLSAPYIGLILIALVIWGYFLFQKSSMKDEGGELNFGSSLKSLWKNKVYCWGVVTQFFYVGLQIAVWTWLIKYVVELTGQTEKDASNIYIYSMLSFIAFRWICTYLMRLINPAVLMGIMALLGCAFTLGTVYLDKSFSIPCAIAISACMSLMFPTIYALALRDVTPEDTKLGAAGLIMAILGGAIIPSHVMGTCIDAGTLSSLLPSYGGAEAAIRSSYLVALGCFAIVLIYSIYAKYQHAKLEA